MLAQRPRTATTGRLQIPAHGKEQMRYIIFFIFLSVSAWATAGSGEKQSQPLRNLPGASEDLESKLKCLKGKSYPNDIEKCGLQGYGDSANQTRFEDCLSSKNGNVVPLRLTPGGQHIKVALIVPCATVKVLAEFEVNSGKYSLVSIGELVD